MTKEDHAVRQNWICVSGKYTKTIGQQSSLENAMNDAKQRMQEIIETPQLSAVEKSELYFDQLLESISEI